MHIFNDRFFRIMFQTGSFYNLLVGLTGILFYNFTIKMMFGPEALDDSFVAAIFFRMFMLAVVIFGIGYFIVSMDLKNNHGIVWLGAISKVIVCAKMGYFYISGLATNFVLIGIFPDVVFTVLFLIFLGNGSKRDGCMARSGS